MTSASRRAVLKSAAALAASPLIGSSALAADALKVGLIYVGPIGDHGWNYAHDQGRKQAVSHFGKRIETAYVENVAEGPDAERVIRNLIQDGCRLVFSTSFGHMNPTIKVARRFPDVTFEHATGYKTAANVANYNARFHEGRAICGTIAGHMSKTGTAGYIASFPIPEVMMGINAFTLAARRVNPDFQTRVLWVSTWYDPAKEADAAKALIDQGADVIAQHTDSPAAIQACEQRGLMAFGQASDMWSFAPNAQLTAIVNNWGPYYVERIGAVLNGTWETQSVWLGLRDGVVSMAPYGPSVPAGVRAAAERMRKGLIDGSVHPFSGPIVDRDGALRARRGADLSDADLNAMDWHVKGVVG